MANNLRFSYQSGGTIYGVMFDNTGNVYNRQTNTIESFSEPSWGQYAITMTQVGSIRHYRGTANPPTNIYTVVYYSQAGGSPSTSDTYIGMQDISWNRSLGQDITAINASVNSLSDGIISDSTIASGQLKKSIAVLGGKSTFDESTGVATYYAADNTTIVFTDTRSKTGTTITRTIN